MKQIIIKYLPTLWNKVVNACLMTTGILCMLFVVKLVFAYYSTHFYYTSIVAVKEYNIIGEPLYFQNNMERYKVTNMHYEDTIRCWFVPDDLFWYSQKKGDYAFAKIGKFKNKWRYEGEIPNVPMVCQLTALPSVNLAFGINTEPQVIESPLFYFVEKPKDIPVVKL